MSENKLLTTSEVAKKLGVTPDCIRKWDESGVLKADYTTEGGHRKYKESTVNEYLIRSCVDKFSETIAIYREKWYQNIYQKILSDEKKSYLYLTDEETKKCIPIIKVGEYDTIALTKDGFKVHTGFHLSEHPFLADGAYSTDMKTRYEYMSALTGKQNPTLKEWIKDDVDNIWGYINWEYYYQKPFRYEKMTSNEFMTILLEKDFHHLMETYDQLLKFVDISESHPYYNERNYTWFITQFAEQIVNYYIIDKCNESEVGDEYIRESFKKGDYEILCVVFKGGVYTFHFDNDSNNSINVHVFDEYKFKIIMESFKHNLVKCEPVDRLVVYVDDIVDKTFGDVKEEEKEDKFTELNTDLNDENKVWKEDELVLFDFPIIGDTEHNRAVSRKTLCPYCKNGNLESKTPTMYNPFSMESQAVCECTYCGETVKTEHAYPRVVFKDENGDDMKVWLS